MQVKKILSMLLIFALILGCAPIAAIADTNDDTGGTSLTKLNNVHETYVDEWDDSELLDSRYSSVSYEEKGNQSLYLSTQGLMLKPCVFIFTASKFYATINLVKYLTKFKAGVCHEPI